MERMEPVGCLMRKRQQNREAKAAKKKDAYMDSAHENIQRLLESSRRVSITKKRSASSMRYGDDEDFDDSAKKNKAFLAVIWFHSPHLPVVASRKDRQPYSKLDVYRRNYFGCVSAMLKFESLR